MLAVRQDCISANKHVTLHRSHPHPRGVRFSAEISSNRRRVEFQHFWSKDQVHLPHWAVQTFMNTCCGENSFLYFFSDFILNSLGWSFNCEDYCCSFKYTMNATEWRHLIKTKTSKSKESTNLLDYTCPLLVCFKCHLVSSVGKAPVCWAGGRTFRPWRDQYSGSLNNWEDTIAFVITSTNS